MVGDPSRSSSSAGTPGSDDAPPAGGRRVLLGELLVASQVITAEQLAEVVAAPRADGKKLGQVLLERGWITEAQLTQTLSLQLSVPWVSLSHVDFSRQLLNRLPRELVERCCLVPIFVRHVKGQGETLYVAMDDPTNEAALAEAGRLAGLPARPMIASASDIRSAIRLYYGDPSGTPAVDVPPPPVRAEPPMTVREGRIEPTSATHPESARSRPPPPPVPDAAHPAKPPVPPSPARPEARRAKISDEERARRRPRMLNLTFLDGTTLALPPRDATEPATGRITTEELVAALRGAANGKSPSEALGEPVQWETIVASLLALLVRKGLLSDREIIEELHKE